MFALGKGRWVNSMMRAWLICGCTATFSLRYYMPLARKGDMRWDTSEFS